MARKTYTSDVEAYLDAELAALRESGRTAVSEEVSLTVFATLRMEVARAIRSYRATALLALLPALVLAARAGLNALPQLGVSTDGWLTGAVQGVLIAAAIWTALALLWLARNAVRRARGQPLISLRFRRNSGPAEYPSFGTLVIKLMTTLATLPALLWLALSGGDSPWLLGALVALPPFILIALTVLGSFLSRLGGLGAANETILEPLPLPGEVRLNERITQLQQMRDWLKDDTLRAMMDDVIGRQVVKSERRQVAYSVIVGVLSLVAGWLLSAVSPVSALAQLLPR